MRSLFLCLERFQSAPPVKGATRTGGNVVVNRQFQSAPPVKGATKCRGICDHRRNVSIRAPREGGDEWKNVRRGVITGFNPRPP